MKTADRSSNQVMNGSQPHTKSQSSKLAEIIGSTITEASDSANETYSNLRNRAQSGYDTSIETVRNHPVYSVMGAALVGFAIGLLTKKSK